VIKIAIVTELFLQVESGQLSTETMIPIGESALVAGSGVLAHLTPGLSLPLGDLATLTISVSDNTASNLCLAAVGGPSVVNARMHDVWGMANTTIHRPIKFALEPGDPQFTATSTPQDMQSLVRHLAEATVIPGPVSAEVLRRMGYVVDSELLPRYLDVNPYASDLRAEAPPFVVRHKGGAVNGVRGDAGVIQRGDQALTVCVFTRDVPDYPLDPGKPCQRGGRARRRSTLQPLLRGISQALRSSRHAENRRAGTTENYASFATLVREAGP
jgi:beta-lactamase class A